MTATSGMRSEAKWRKVLVLFSVCKKLKNKMLIALLFVILPLGVLTSMISCRQWVHQEGFC